MIYGYRPEYNYKTGTVEMMWGYIPQVRPLISPQQSTYNSSTSTSDSTSATLIPERSSTDKQTSNNKPILQSTPNDACSDTETDVCLIICGCFCPIIWVGFWIAWFNSKNHSEKCVAWTSCGCLIFYIIFFVSLLVILLTVPTERNCVTCPWGLYKQYEKDFCEDRGPYELEAYIQCKESCDTVACEIAIDNYFDYELFDY